MLDLDLINEMLPKVDALERHYVKEYDELKEYERDPGNMSTHRMQSCIEDNLIRCQRIRHLLSDMLPKGKLK